MKSNKSDAAAKGELKAGGTIGEDTPVQYLKGIGPARARLLGRLGIKTAGDLLYHFPWRYEDRRNLKKICHLRYGEVETTAGEVVSSAVITTPRKKMKIFELTVTDGSGILRAKWFAQPYLKKYFHKGDRVILNGMVKGNAFAGPGVEMENPDFEVIDAEDRRVHTSRIVPFYRATEGISPKQLRGLMFNALAKCSSILVEWMPQDILERNDLPPLHWAVKEAHFPEEIEDAGVLNAGRSAAHRRLIFDELFLLQLGLARIRKKEILEEGISFNTEGGLSLRFRESLPFELTAAQKRVVGEIAADMKRPVPMNRLVHGDVGCGKTVVALSAMLAAVDSGYQACLMAPTEILAEQHFINIQRMAEPIGVNVVLLTSGSGTESLEEIAGGDAQLIIGTHSLIQEHVEFNNLGLAVIDEQHRFGVVQRAALRHKGANPDILVMTATPIPRTLTLTLYGDLDVSVIDELPAGRKPVRTKVFFESQKRVIYEIINRELALGRQAYVVYPLIEESEKLQLKSAIDGAAALQKFFPGRKVGLVHGRMHHSERESVMSDFKAAKIDILVATTVIEVGIDVPNASLMLIVHAERFGLAQLHQLRGRIGRGEFESHCLLLAYHPLSEEARRRLKAMEETSDGFRIAEEDLTIRGPGDFFGTRQSGIPELQLADIVRDFGLLERARREAFALAESDPELEGHPLLRERLYRKWVDRIELVKS